VGASVALITLVVDMDELPDNRFPEHCFKNDKSLSSRNPRWDAGIARCAAPGAHVDETLV
jgi:hypothetical protein